MKQTNSDTNKLATSKVGKQFGYIAAMVVNIVIIFVLNNLLAWGFPYLTSDFRQVLPYLNASLVVTVIFNFSYLFFTAKWFKNASEMIGCIFSFIAACFLIKIFPFDFSSIGFTGFTSLFNVALWLGAGGIVIAFIVNLVKLIYHLSLDSNGKNKQTN